MPDLLDDIAQTRIVPAGHYGTAGSGVTVMRAEGVQIASIVTAPGRYEMLDAGCRAAFALALPAGPHHVSGPEIAIVGTGPGRWLAVSSGIADLEGRLREALSPAAAICDQSDGYILFDMAGAKVRDALQKIVAIDLDSGVFRRGDAATTPAAGHIAATFWQLDEEPIYRFAVGRSFAPSFSRAVVTAAAEFGCTVGSTAEPSRG